MRLLRNWAWLDLISLDTQSMAPKRPKRNPQFDPNTTGVVARWCDRVRASHLLRFVFADLLAMARSFPKVEPSLLQALRILS